MKIMQLNLQRGNDDIPSLLDTLLKEDPDVFFFEEFCYYAHAESIVDRLSRLGYRVILPYGFEERDKTNPRITAACMLAVKSEHQFLQRCRPGIQQSYRYIEGTLLPSGSDRPIECFFAYVQQLYWNERQGHHSAYAVNTLMHKAEMKANMLFEMYRFFEENRTGRVFIGGDLNTNIDSDSARMRSLFQALYDNTADTHLSKSPTWNGQRLDYALVSKELFAEAICETVGIATSSDHLALCTQITDIQKR